MFNKSIINKLSTQLAVAFLLAAILGVALVAILTYNATTSNLSTFIGHMGGMGMMGNVVLEAQREFVDNLEWNLWLAGFLGAVLALVLSVILTRQIVSPLSRITLAAQKVRLGDLNQRVDIGGSSELGDLGNSFNNMVEKLRYDQELRYKMVADIAHELRNPLSIVQGNVEAMLDGVMPADDQTLNSLHQETLLLSRLVEDLRTLSLAESGQLNFYPQEMDLVDLIRNVVDGFKAQFATKNIRLKITGSEKLPRVWADKDRTAQIIRNLLSNSFYYTPNNGSVRINLASNSESVTVSINDSGTGIPREDLRHIFERFYRVDHSRSRKKTGGSGLGLAIVKQLVEVQGGKVWVESVMDKGSSFYFNLPLSK